MLPSGMLTNTIRDKTKCKPVTHNWLHVGDVVVLKEANTKPSNYPMGILKSVVFNDLNEVTDATILKGVPENGSSAKLVL